MALAADAQISGQGGWLGYAYTPGVIGGSANATVYAPFAGFEPTIVQVQEVVPSVNNISESANTMVGITSCPFTLTAPFSPTAFPVAFFNDAFLSYASDDSTFNYFKFTASPNVKGGTASGAGKIETYQLCKFGSLRLSASFVGGGARVQPLVMSGLCCDPEHGTALTAPTASHAVNTDQIWTYAQAKYTEATSVVSVSLSIGTQLRPAEGVVAGSGSYPWLLPGSYQGGFDPSSTLTVVQYRSAGTVPTTGMTFQFGPATTGVLFTCSFIPISIAKPLSMGSNLMVSTYRLVTADGTTPAVVVSAGV
jgi:hypothetical protein